MNINAESLERTVTLCDGRTGVRAALEIQARAATRAAEADAAGAGMEAGPVLDFIASNGTLDRYREIIDPAGWRLENYRRNPVFQNAHNYGDILFTLGKALVTEVREGRLYQRIQFATTVNPVARIAHGLYQGGFLNAVSVGFIPLRWENGNAETPFRRKYLEQELLEVSAVGIPANPDALALGLKSGAVARSDVRDLLELLNSLASSPPVAGASRAGMPNGGTSPAQADRSPAPLPKRALMNVARELRRVLSRA